MHDDDEDAMTGDERLRVLVVDDEPRHREMCRLALAQFPAIDVVGEAHNGRRGVELAAQLQPDVVVLDLRMPIMDGLTALPRILRASPFSRVIVWSGDAPVDLQAALDAGAAAVVRKPAPIDHLVTVLLGEAAGVRS